MGVFECCFGCLVVGCSGFCFGVDSRLGFRELVVPVIWLCRF